MPNLMRTVERNKKGEVEQAQSAFSLRHVKRAAKSQNISPKAAMEVLLFALKGKTDLASAQLSMHDKLVTDLDIKDRQIEGQERIQIFTSFDDFSILRKAGTQISGKIQLNMGVLFPSSRLTISLIGVEETDVGSHGTEIREIINMSFARIHR